MPDVIDHLSLGVADAARSRAFYDAALAPLGYGAVKIAPYAVGYGDDRPVFWIEQVPPPGPGAPTLGAGCHVAFAAPRRAAVDAFHAAALAAGGRDNGGPGLRPRYHANYYAAFVLDPDGNRIEAVCNLPDP